MWRFFVAPIYAAWRVCGGVAAGAVAVACSLWAPPAAAASSVQVLVGARVLPYARLQERIAPTLLQVTPDDVARGFVDAAQDWVLSVRSNDPVSRGLLFEYADSELPIERARVSGLGTPLWLGPSAGWVALAGAHSPGQETLVSLRVRFYLSPQATAGLHAWPLRVRLQAP
ncbi:MAG TPA: hypothetical protein VLJ86_00515 [Ramlibacter sp.]|nr:hypothetical protein [Ramlibacter sp.]